MITECTKSSNGKLLAAVIAMLMIVCAVAVIASPSEGAATPYVPSETDKNLPFAETEDVISYVNGLYTLSGDATIDLTAEGNYGTSDKPMNIHFSLGSNVLTLKNTSTTAVDVYIHYVTQAAGNDTSASVVFFGTFENSNYGGLVLDGKINMHVVIDKASTVTTTPNNGNHIFMNADITLNNGAQLTLTQMAGVGGKTTYCSSTENLCTLTMDNGSNLVLDSANGIDYKADVSDSSISIQNPKKDTAFINLAKDSSIVDSTITSTTGADNGMDLYIDEATSITGTTINMGAADVVIVAGNTVTMDDASSITAKQIKYRVINETTTGAAAINGGSVSGEYTVYDEKTAAASFSMDGTIVAGTVGEKATLKSTGEGITVNENLRNKGTIDLNTAGMTVNGKFTNAATVSGINSIVGDGSVTNDGTMGAPVEVPGYTNNASADLVVYGDSTGSQWYPAKQNITVPAGETWTIIKDNVIVIPGVLNVEGSLVIEDGGVLVVGGIIANDTTGRTGFGTTTVEDSLTVEEGGTLAVAYGNLNVNGTAKIDGAVYIGIGYDNVNATGAPTVPYTGKDANLNLNSNTAFSETSTIKAASGKVVVAQDVTLAVEGAVMSALSIENSGAVVFDSEPLDPTKDDGSQFYLASGITVSMAADGASVSIENLAIKQGGSVTITDKGLAVDSKGKKVETADENILIVNSGAFVSSQGSVSDVYRTCVISGLTVVENFDGVKKATDTEPEKILNTMDISGNLSVSGEKDADVSMFVWTQKGDFTISDAGENAAALTVGDNVTLCNHARLTVSGYVPVSTDKDDAGTIMNKVGTDTGTITLAGNGHIYMSDKGIVDMALATTTLGINATYYETTVDTADFANYVTFDAALAAANADSTIDELTLLGENKLTASATMPAITLTFDDKSGATLAVGDKDNRDVVLTVTADADYGAEGKTTVYGTVFFNDRRDLKNETNMISDVKSYQVDAEGKEVKNGWARYTNIYTAMTEAEAGDVITISKIGDYVELTSDFTVKEGVTLKIPAETGGIRVMNGVTLTVAGTIVSEKTSLGITAAKQFATKASSKTGEEASAIVVTGTLKAAETVDYGTTSGNTLATSKIAGAYFTDDEDYDYVTTVANAVSANVLPTIVGYITINGTVAEGDITFTATDYCTTIVIGSGAKVTLTSLTLANEAVLTDDSSEDNGYFTGTVTIGDASIETVKVKGLKVTSANGLTIAGAVVNYTEEDVNDGKNQATLNASAGTVIVSSVTGDMTVDAGATLTVPATSTSVPTTSGSITEKLFVDGTVNVTSGQTLTVGALYVDGTVNVAAAEGTSAEGTLTVENNIMYVGLDDKYNVTSATATVNGTVDCEVIYAAAGTTVTMDEDVFTESTEYMVEGALWITAYAVDGKAPSIAGVNPADFRAAVPVENAYFDGTWVSAEDSNKKVTVDDKTPTYVGAEYFEVVNAQVKYDVYTINLKADQNAVSSISIDGNLMQFGMIAEKDAAGNNTGSYYYGYTLVLEAGSHTVQYQLVNGYSGNGVLTVNGVQQSGLTFTTEGTPESADGITYNLQLSGFEKSGYVPDSPDTGSDSGDSGMTITDYLLIVLVVLIVIMAIIVAMRLMRS